MGNPAHCGCARLTTSRLLRRALVPTGEHVSYSHLSPKVGASHDVSREFNVFASYRNGFRTPSQGQLFQQNSARNTVGLIPAKVNSYELGMRDQLGQRFVYQVSAYDMTNDR